MKSIVVIGGGAAGLVAAIHACSRDCQVLLVEKNSIFGKKILVTGNGRCNYWNEDQNIFHYHSMNSELLKDIITFEHQKQVKEFFAGIGIVPKIKQGYYYPYSNQAISVRNALEAEAQRRGVIFKDNFTVTKVEKMGDGFHICSDSEELISDQVVIATGSKAFPKTGSVGDGYFFAEEFGHFIVPVLPALVQLRCDETYLKDWAGVRVDSRVSLYEDGRFIKSEEGEVQLTDYGISGICTFNLSRYVARGLAEGKKEKIRLSFLPYLEDDFDSFYDWLDHRSRVLVGRNLMQLLEGVLPYKLITTILKVIGLDKSKFWQGCLDSEKRRLVQALMSFEIMITGTNSFEQAQVCSGGVSLEEVSLQTFESKIVPGLYFVGEVLDVDGDCGGYNLGFAWISGMLDRKSVV